MTDPNEAPMCRVGDNNLDTGKIPIVFVPGVMGTRLSIDNAFDWDPDKPLSRMLPGWIMASAGTLSNKLEPPAANGGAPDAPVLRESSGLSDEQEERGWGEVAKDFYRGFLRALDNMSFGAYETPVYAAGYDWRQSNAVSGQYMARRIGEILEAEEADHFILISHSMGGLVTRSCLKDSSETREKCLGVMHIAQPVDGAPAFIRRMFDGAAQDDFTMYALLGGNRRTFQKIVSKSTGPIQLLVTPNYRDSASPHWWYDYNTFERPDDLHSWQGESWSLYLQSASPPGVLAPVDSLGSIDGEYRNAMIANIGRARAFHTDLGHWKYPEKTWTIYGDGVPNTDMRAHFNLPPEDADVAVFRTALSNMGTGMGGMGGGTVWYTAERADGTEVTLTQDQVHPMNRGYATRSSDYSPHCRRNDGDGTVPAPSAMALYPGQSHEYAADTDYDARRQFVVHHNRGGNATHDAICDHSKARQITEGWIRHLIALGPG